MFAFQMTGINTASDLRGVLCEGRGLDRYILFSSREEKAAFQNVSCSLTPQELISTQQVLLRNLDGEKLLSEASRPCPINDKRACLILNFRSTLINSEGGDVTLHDT